MTTNTFLSPLESYFRKSRKVKKEEFYSDRGDFMRGKGERKIADFLYEQGIAYEYEKRVMVGGESMSLDFYLPQYGIYIEYWGMQGNENYEKNMIRKRKLFAVGKIKVIELFPEHMRRMEGNIKYQFERLTDKAFPQVKFFDWRI